MRRLSVLLSLLAALLLGLPGALAQADPFADAGLPELAITLTDEGPQGVPAETAAGRYLVSFTNDVSDTGDPFTDAWSVEFVRLPAGMTVDDLAALFAAGAEGEGGGEGTPVTEAGEAVAEASPAGEDPFAFIYEGHLAGGPGALRGETAQGVVDLPPGDYAVATFGIGMPVAMTVTGEAAASPAAGDIAASATITETGTSGSFDFAAEGLAPGPGVLAIANDSDQPHFVFALRSEDPITEDAVMALLMEDEGDEGGAGASPVASPAGGPEGISPAFITGTQSPDTTQYLAVDLEPGYYILLCFVGDPSQGGIPHAFEGMIAIVPVGV